MKTSEINWTEHYKNWEKSKISQKKYCIENNLSYATFRYHITKTKLNEKSTSVFTELEFEPQIQDSSVFSLKLHQDGSIHFKINLELVFPFKSK